MKTVLKFYSSSIGKKVVVAVTGVVLFGFVAMHMLGNLKTFMGYDAAGVHHLDTYAHFLREVGQEVLGYRGVLWLTRIVLLVSILLHIFTVLQLQQLNTRARPMGYKLSPHTMSTQGSRTMLVGGAMLAIFIVYHLLHFTFGTVHFEGFKEGAVYANVYNGFQVWYVVVIYLAAMGFLGLHLYHGVWSLGQTLGLNREGIEGGWRCFAKATAIVISVGFALVPLAAMLHALPVPITK